jgi:hypothetical protein
MKVNEKKVSLKPQKMAMNSFHTYRLARLAAFLV